MASKTQQRERFRDAQQFGERLMKRELATWTGNVIAEWDTSTPYVPQEAETELTVILRRTYDKTANRMIGADWRLYKQDEEPDPFDEAMIAIAATFAVLFPARVLEAGNAILSTLRQQMRRATAAAAEDMEATAAQRARTARSDLGRRMRNHRLTIAVTESGWTVNKAQSTAILSVKDPLQNSVERIAQLFEEGRNTEARRLARRVLRLARLPTSVSQGTLLNTVSDARDRLVTPGAQGRMIATMRDQARRLDATKKVWVAVFHNTRETHAAAHGQERDPDEPFDIGGFPMQAPYDATLGAPIKEWANCQCMLNWL